MSQKLSFKELYKKEINTIGLPKCNICGKNFDPDEGGQVDYLWPYYTTYNRCESCKKKIIPIRPGIEINTEEQNIKRENYELTITEIVLLNWKKIQLENRIK